MVEGLAAQTATANDNNIGGCRQFAFTVSRCFVCRSRAGASVAPLPACNLKYKKFKFYNGIKIAKLTSVCLK